MRKNVSASFITLNSRLEQHSATILKFASFVHIVYTKTTINIHMRISQMRNRIPRSLLHLYRDSSFVYFVHIKTSLLHLIIV